ncbi:MAG TPA: CpXC domain-containing protein [Anaerolineales bacterium]|nr:CpXC domain-containing protein [Anaerolineales bacterium]
MPKTRINCPNCRQPAFADIDQLFDVGTDPTVKQRILSGAFNVVACQSCGYQGVVATPIVYHDPNKEMLLTYFPAEMGLPVNEQERIIGPLITKATNSLPQEKRKAYLLRPQTMFTMQSMIERILEADGITKEMIQAQQRRMELLQRLLNSSDEQIVEIANTEDQQLDGEFYNLLNRLVETAMVSGDQNSASRLSDLQKKLVPITSYGQKIQEQSKEVEDAIQSLQKIGKDLTREKLLDLVLQVPNDIQLSVIVSLTRPGMDYQFFQLLSQRIDQANGSEQARLVEIRGKILEMTRTIDAQVEANLTRARTLLNSLLQSPNIKEAIIHNLPAVDEYFIQVFDEARESARKNADLDKISRLGQIEEVLSQASKPPQEVALIEELLDTDDEQSMMKVVQARQSEITPQFMEILSSLVTRTQEGQDPELAERVQMLYRIALQVSMQANM